MRNTEHVFTFQYYQEPIPTCGGVQHGNGTIESPDFPAHYPASTKCRWIIHAEENKKIVLHFDAFRTEPGRDYLTASFTSVSLHTYQ